mgnify:CR=1 FL=1
MANNVMTVTGPISPGDMGLTLPHEHVMVDFIGADKVGKHRYRPDDVVSTMLPYVKEAQEQGVRTFVDCTPMYLGRDVEVLRTISELTGLQILTNTGQYKEPICRPRPSKSRRRSWRTGGFASSRKASTARPSGLGSSRQRSSGRNWRRCSRRSSERRH